MVANGIEMGRKKPPERVAADIERFMDTFANFPEFNRILESVVSETEKLRHEPAKLGRKPSQTMNLVIEKLARIYAECTHENPRVGFSNTGKDREASSPFLSFLDETLVAFDPAVARSNSALASAVRRVLEANYPKPT